MSESICKSAVKASESPFIIESVYSGEYECVKLQARVLYKRNDRFGAGFARVEIA